MASVTTIAQAKGSNLTGNDHGAPGPGQLSTVGASDQPRLLQQALERYRDIESRGGWKKFSSDLVMGPEYSYDCSVITALEKRLMAEGYLRELDTPPPLAPPQPGQPLPAPCPPPRCPYTPALTAAVRAFQQDRKILGYGQVGSQTVTQLNRPVGEIINLIQHDLTRWRNVSLDESGTYVLVNIPFYEMRLYDGGRQVLAMPVIVGQTDWQTPLINAEIEHIIVNPDWGIPVTIAKKEILPNAQKDANYLRREGIDASGGCLRQKPGPRNPLGRIKFVMPNPYDVYLHDTPFKGAFSAAVRALSHGCVRLSQPMDLATYLLRDDPQWKPARLQEEIAKGRTEQINPSHRLPVHIIYSTTRVNDEGRLEVRADIYKKNDDGAEQRGGSDESLSAWP